MPSTIERLCVWYRSQCDGDWEHSYGVKIENLDNPGWLVKVDLTGTDLVNEAFPARNHENLGAGEWIHCHKDGPLFVGACGPTQLDEVLRSFLDWAEQARDD